jgi:hypothetical protein
LFAPKKPKEKICKQCGKSIPDNSITVNMVKEKNSIVYFCCPSCWCESSGHKIRNYNFRNDTCLCGKMKIKEDC